VGVTKTLSKRPLKNGGRNVNRLFHENVGSLQTAEAERVTARAVAHQRKSFLFSISVSEMRKKKMSVQKEIALNKNQAAPQESANAYAGIRCQDRPVGDSAESSHTL
jgi:hypothetical protein